jgi:hypothetical protein
MRRAALTILVAVSLAAATVSLSEAQPNATARPVAVEWTAPEECPGVDYVESQIDALLAGAAASPAPALRAQATVRRERDGGWRVDLTTAIGADVGHRALTAESCRAVADATALILALAVDPERVASNRSTVAPASASAPPSAEVPPAPSASASRTLPRARPSVVVRRPRVVPPPSPPPTFALEVGGALEMGTLPSVTPEMLLTVAVVPALARDFRFEATGAISAFSSVESPPTMSGKFELRVAGVGACFLPIAGAVELGLCAGAEVDSLAGSGLAETRPRNATATWVALRPHATLAYPFVPGWALRLDGGAGIALARPEFDSTGIDSGFIHRTAEVSGRVSFGVELRF